MAQLQLSLLGPFALTEKGQPVDLHIAKMQALLAYLALTATATPRDQLLALLWAESHPDAARKNLRNRLWQLRQLTDAELVIADGDTLALAPTVESDVATFTTGLTQQLAAATIDESTLQPLLDMWRGPLLEGLQLHEAPDFELWLSQQREQVGQLYLRALEALLQQHIRQSDWNDVITLAQRGLAYDALHEPFVQQLMIGYAQQGQRAEALRQYEQLQKRLRIELDVEPLPETMALRRQIATGHQSEPTGKVVNTSVETPKLEVAVDLAQASQLFVGRRQQLAALTQAYAESRQGRCRVVLIGGELGMGKTTLWQQWVAGVSHDATVLSTRCLNTTQSLPFEPMRRLLSTLRCRKQWATIANDLLPIWQAELLRLAPSLQSAHGNTTDDEHTAAPAGPSHLPPAEERGLIAEALTQFLRTFGHQPLILFIDDLHWADSATLDWLVYLTDRMAGEPLLLVGAYRPEEMASQVTNVTAQWQRDGILHRVDLPHFTADEATTLLTALGTDERVIQYLHQQSGGNPYYLTQLSDVAVDGIPASLSELVQTRLRYLDENWQPVLQAAAVLEPAIDLTLLMLTSDRSEEATIDAIDGLLSASILVEQGEEYEFVHPLVATVMRKGLSNGRRKLLHRRAAEGLLARHQGQEGEIAGQLANHFAAAGIQDQAALFATMAGGEALRIGAANEAVTFYRQAFALAPTAERQLGLGQALLLQPGELEAARRQMEAALDSYEAAGDCQGATKAGLRLAASFLGTQEGAQVLHWARRVLPDLEAVDDPMLHASAHYLMGTAKFRNGYSLHEAEGHYQTGMNIVTEAQLEPEIGLMICFEWGNLALERGEYATAVTKFQQAQQLAKQWQSVFFEVLTYNNLAYAQLLNGEPTSAQQAIAKAFTLADEFAMQSTRYYLLSTQGEIALAIGALDTADEAFQQAVELAQKYNNQTFVANLWAHQGRVQQARGNLVAAQAHLESAHHALADEGLPYLQTQIELWLAAVALEQQDSTTADTYLGAVLERPTTANYQQLQQIGQQLRTQLTGAYSRSHAAR